MSKKPNNITPRQRLMLAPAERLGATGLRARMLAGDPTSAELFIYDDIGFLGITAEDVANELTSIGHVAQLDIRINTKGGDLDQALAIMSVVRRAADHVTTSVDGAALSAGSLIAQVGDVRQTSSAGLWMLHEPWGMPVGNAARLRSEADALDIVSETAANAYADRTGRPVAEIASMMRGDDGADGTWFGPQAAVDAGLVDRIVQATPVSMAFDQRTMHCGVPDWAAELLVGDGDPRVPHEMAAAAARRRADIDRRVRVAEAALWV